MQVFNDIYINCRYACMFNMLYYFKKNPVCLLLNVLPIYLQNESVSVEYRYFVNNKTFLKKMGIDEKEIDFSHNLKELIKSIPERDVLIIKNEDFYNESSTFYKRELHHGNNLILSYFQSNDSVEALTQSGVDTYKYEIIPVQKIIDSYNGYLKEYYFTSLDVKPTVLIYSNRHEVCKNLEKNFYKLLFKNKKSYMKNIEFLKKYFSTYDDYSDEENLKNIVKIELVKKIDFYRCSALELSDTLCLKQIQILQKIKLIICRNSINKKEKLRILFSKFIELENEYLLLLFKEDI